MRLLGLDHADIRVRSLSAVEPFYEQVFPTLGLSRKTESHVDAQGEWQAVDEQRPRNVIEFHTPIVAGSSGWFVGLIEDPRTPPTATRIAFVLERRFDFAAVERLVRDAGGLVVEMSGDDTYPALFFEDPVGTRLEICARLPRA